MNVHLIAALLRVIADQEIEAQKALDRGEELDKITIDELAEEVIFTAKSKVPGDYTGCLTFVITVLCQMPIVQTVIGR